MSRILNRTLLCGSLPLFSLLCSIRPEEEPSGGGGGAAPASAPTEPLRPEVAPATAEAEPPASAPDSESASDERRYHLALFASTPGEAGLPALEISFGPEVADSLDRVMQIVGLSASRLLLRGLGIPDLHPRTAAPPSAVPTPEQHQQQAQETARRFVVQQAAHGIAAEASRLRVEATVSGDVTLDKRATELEARLVDLLASLPPDPYGGHAVIPRGL